MTPAPPSRRPIVLPSPRRERVHDRLKRIVGEGIAAFFADAFDVLQLDPGLRTATHLVGHLLREVESAMREVLLNLPAAKTYLAEHPPVEDGKAHAAQNEAIAHALGTSEVAVAAARALRGNKRIPLQRVAHRPGLKRPRRVDESFVDDIERFVDLLDLVLDAAEANYAAIVRGLEEIIVKTNPSKAELDAVAPHLAAGAAALAVVFERLPASWLVPLRDKGVFAEPPDTITHDDGSVTYPFWPQAGYLARIAADMPKQVADTIEQIPTVDNESPHVEFLEAACRLPAADAARVAEHELPWLSSRRWVLALLSVNVGTLVGHLLANFEMDAAIKLLRVALVLVPRGERQVPRFDPYNYGEIVRQQIPRLAEIAPDAARDLLLEVLVGSETSWWRREHVAGTAQSGLDDPRDHVFEQLRDLYLRRAGANATSLRAVIDELERLGSPLYRRLAYYVLEQHGRLAPELIVQRVIDQARLDDVANREALVAMLRARFGDLQPEQREAVIAALRENCSDGHVLAELGGGDRDPAEVHELARWKLLRWFHGLGPARPDAVAAEYAQLVAEMGDPTERDSVKIRTGPNPPRDARALSALGDPELLTFLRDWAPATNDSIEPSREGLGREIKKCVDADAKRFARLARDFRGLAQPYIANLCWGIHDHVQRWRNSTEKDERGPELDCDSLLDLLEWTAQQPDTDQTAWRWARRISVDVAEDVFALSVPGDHTRMRRAWAVMRTLLRDADPTPERDAEYGADLDPFAINTVRGQALHAAIRIGRALRAAGIGAPAGLVEEVIAEIVAHSDAAIEPSLAIRCVLAFELNAIYNIDPAAAAQVAAQLLPRRGEDTLERRAAWQCFLRWNAAAGVTYDLLCEAYALAIESVGSASAEDAGRLGDHLVALAAAGLFDLDAGDQPLRSFLERAAPDARHHALEGIGRNIYQAEEIDAAVVARLRAIWEWWTALAIARRDPGELRAFGWWFTSRHFDTDWSMPMLDRALAATSGRVDWQHEVIEKLVALAPTLPDAVAGCLERLTETRDNWDMIGGPRQIRSLITALLSTPAAGRARIVAARLVARGRTDFRDLA